MKDPKVLNVPYGIRVHHEFNQSKPHYSVHNIIRLNVFAVTPNDRPKQYCIRYVLKGQAAFVAKFISKEKRDNAVRRICLAAPNENIKLSFLEYFHIPRNPRQVAKELNSLGKTLSFPKTVGEQLALPIRLGMNIQDIMATDLFANIDLSVPEFISMVAGIEPPSLASRNVSLKKLAQELAKIFDVPGVIFSRGVSKEEYFYFLLTNLKRV